MNFLKDLGIDAEEDDASCKGWKWLKMIFEGKDWQALQTLIEMGTITPESHKIPCQNLNAIATTVKSEENFWHFWDKLHLDVHAVRWRNSLPEH